MHTDTRKLRWLVWKYLCLSVCIGGSLNCLTSCESVQSIIDAAPKPTARIAGVSLGNLSLDGATLDFDVDVRNPYGFNLPLADLAYSISSGGKSVLSGNMADPGSIPANNTRRIAVPVSVRFADLLNVLGGVKPGSVLPYDANLSVSANVPNLGPLTLPLKKSGKLPIPAVPQVTLADVKWGNMTLNDASALLRLGITNTNDFSMKLSQLSYALSLGGVDVANTSVRKAANFAGKGSSQTLEIPISIKPINLGMAAFNMLRGEGAGYRMRGNLSAQTPFGPVNLPYDSSGQTSFSR